MIALTACNKREDSIAERGPSSVQIDSCDGTTGRTRHLAGAHRGTGHNLCLICFWSGRVRSPRHHHMRRLIRCGGEGGADACAMLQISGRVTEYRIPLIDASKPLLVLLRVEKRPESNFPDDWPPLHSLRKRCIWNSSGIGPLSAGKWAEAGLSLADPDP